MRVKIEHVWPPIPVRTFDFAAYDESRYEPGHPIGYGATPDEAMADLMEQMELGY